jgi:hypothetical protein
VLGHASILFLRRRRKVSVEGGVAGIVRENAGAARLNLSCDHMLIEGSSGKVLLQIQAPDHFKVRLTIGDGLKKKKRTPFRKSMASSMKSLPLTQG